MDRPALPVQRSLLALTPRASRRNTYEDLVSAFGLRNTPSSVTRARRSASNSMSAKKPAAPAARILSASPDPLSISYTLASPTPAMPPAMPRGQTPDMATEIRNNPSTQTEEAAHSEDLEATQKEDLEESQSDVAFHSQDATQRDSATQEEETTQKEDATQGDATPSEAATPTRILRPRRNRTEVDYSEWLEPSRGSSGKKQNKKLLVSDMLASPKPTPKKSASTTARTQIRADIALHTKVKRDAFLYRHGEYFVPLLPENNYVAKLSNQNHGAFVSYRELEEQPEGITATLKPYQLSGLSFLAHMNDNGMPCMLGDEMGLGKTLQTLSLFQLLEERGSSRSAENRPYLVVCPLSVVNSWVNEANRWAPGLKVLRFHGPKSERELLKKIATGKVDRFGKETARSKKRTGDRRRAGNKITVNMDDDDDDIYNLVVTSYDILQAEQTWFRTAFVWRYIVLDEGHRIKNSNTQLSHALQNIRAEYRMILTGTPLQNNLLEVWALLHWMLPDVFTDKTDDLFKKSFNLSRGQVDTSVMDSARSLLELLMLRRMKDSPGVDLNLPPKEEVLLYVPLTPLQRFWYMRLLTRSGDDLLEELFSEAKNKEQEALERDIADDKKIKALEAAEGKVAGEASTEADVWGETRAIVMQNLANEQNGDKKGDWTKLMNLIMQLRKCCSHPYLLPGVQPDPYLLGDHVIRSSGKFIVLEKLLEDLILERGKKVIIFSGFRDTLNLCEDLLVLLGADEKAFRFLRFDGQTDRARRNLDIRLFNDTSTDYMAMLVSTRAGGLGINLTAATEAIFLDEDWNPQITLQAEARAHRIGQTKPVTIYKLCTQGTVEEQMMGRIHKKLYLSAKITESMKSVYGTPANIKRKRNEPANDDDKPNLDVSQLKTLVRRGAQTLSRPAVDITEMLSWDLDTVLEKCRDKPSDPQVGDEYSVDEVHSADEQKWLATMERVETAIFDGRRIQRSLDVSDRFTVQTDLVRDDRRKGKNTTVMVDGYAINKESMACDDWEAVPTLAGKDPRLAERTREKKKPVVNQDHCQACWDGGEIWLCTLCPRSFHAGCLTPEQRGGGGGGGVRLKTQFCCPQHGCADCGKRTAEAGGMLYRCRFCPLAFCEDCLDFDRARLIGGALPELELLGCGERSQAFFVCCHACAELHDEQPDVRAFCEEQASAFAAQLDQFREMQRLKRERDGQQAVAGDGADDDDMEEV